MDSERVIYVSAVSDEFHRTTPERCHEFQSYRDVLKQAFRILAPHYEVVVQEDLIQGFGDLLETLEHEIARSLFIIHLVGDLAGVVPEPEATRRLDQRNPDLMRFVSHLSADASDHAGVTYTQWELYLSLHQGKRVLIFEARLEAPRALPVVPAAVDITSQKAHRRRINASGLHRGTFYDQGDVARKAMRSFLHFRVDPLVDPAEPTADDMANAWKHQEEIVKQLAAAIRKPDPRAVPVVDPANTAAFAAAVRVAAERWRVNLATIVNIAAHHEEQVRATLGEASISETLYDEAFASLALGDYTAARFYARRAADTALKLLEQEPENAPYHRDDAKNSLLLLHDAAKAVRDPSAAIAALEEAAALIDKETDPLRWAEVNETLAAVLLEQALLDRADELVSDIIDIREEHQGENHPAVAGTLLLWASLLEARANYRGVEAVAARAERIFVSQAPLDLSGVAAALSYRGIAFLNKNQLEEAEPLLRQALDITKQHYGSDHPSVAIALNNLGSFLREANRSLEAEPLLRRALDIDELNYGTQHQSLIYRLNNLALLLEDTKRFSEAETLLRRAVAVAEQSYGNKHPAVSVSLSNLAGLLHQTNRHSEAEPLMWQGLAIDEGVFGPEHPRVAVGLTNLGEVLRATNRLAEAEPLMRRALAINAQCYGADHPNVAVQLNNVAQLLQDTNQFAEAELLMRRALAIDEQSYGDEHPLVAIRLNNLAELLRATNRLVEAEPLLRRAVTLLSQFSQITGHDHPSLEGIIINYLSLLLQIGQNMGDQN